MYNHNKAQQSKNRVHISWDILYVFLALTHRYVMFNWNNICVSDPIAKNYGGGGG